jgi:Fe-S-cluster-containing dehydrogenase component
MKKISRRFLLKGGLAGGALTILTKKKEALAAKSASPNTYPDGMGVLVDFSRCIGCRSCEAACNKVNNLPEPDLPFDDISVFEHKRRTHEKARTIVNKYEVEGHEGPIFRKVQCNHCNEPGCLSSCFVNAYTKTDTGAVIYNSKVCVGCRTCMIACPFYIPAYSYSSVLNPIVIKCTMCYDTRLVHGKPPGCVEACPRDVMTFGKRKDLIFMAHQRIRLNPGKYVNHLYGEKEVGGTAWMYLSPVPFEEMGFNTTLGEKPIFGYVKEFLSIVPMVLTIWPALFSGFYLLATRKSKSSQESNEQVTGEEDNK